MYPARRLYRSIDEKKIGGVSAGLAEYLSLPVVFVRIFFLILLFAGPGLPIYVLFWVLTPKDPAEGYRRRRRLRFGALFMIALATLTGMSLAGALGASEVGVLTFGAALLTGLLFVRKGRNLDAEEADELPDYPDEAVRLRPSREIVRDEDARIYGVCSRLAGAVGIDPVVVRIILVVLTPLTFPVVPIAYVLAALIMPRAIGRVAGPAASNLRG